VKSRTCRRSDGQRKGLHREQDRAQHNSKPRMTREKPQTDQQSNVKGRNFVRAPLTALSKSYVSVPESTSSQHAHFVCLFLSPQQQVTTVSCPFQKRTSILGWDCSGPRNPTTAKRKESHPPKKVSKTTLTSPWLTRLKGLGITVQAQSAVADASFGRMVSTSNFFLVVKASKSPFLIRLPLSVSWAAPETGPVSRKRAQNVPGKSLAMETSGR
jgi:hypothetical protein